MDVIAKVGWRSRIIPLLSALMLSKLCKMANYWQGRSTTNVTHTTTKSLVRFTTPKMTSSPCHANAPSMERMGTVPPFWEQLSMPRVWLPWSVCLRNLSAILLIATTCRHSSIATRSRSPWSQPFLKTLRLNIGHTCTTKPWKIAWKPSARTAGPRLARSELSTWPWAPPSSLWLVCSDYNNLGYC